MDKGASCGEVPTGVPPAVEVTWMDTAAGLSDLMQWGQDGVGGVHVWMLLSLEHRCYY